MYNICADKDRIAKNKVKYLQMFNIYVTRLDKIEIDRIL